MEENKDTVPYRRLLIFHISDFVPEYSSNMQMSPLPNQWAEMLNTFTWYEDFFIMFLPVGLSNKGSIKNVCQGIYTDIEDYFYERILFQDLSFEVRNEFLQDNPEYNEDEDEYVESMKDSCFLVVFLGSDKMAKYITNYVKNGELIEDLNEFHVSEVNINMMGYLLTELLVPRGLKGEGKLPLSELVVIRN